MNISKELSSLVSGDIHTDNETLQTHSIDTSIFKVTPEVVVYPKDTEDVKKIVRFVSEHKREFPNLSITGRGAGTDMTGGPLNESIILGFTKYFNHFSVDSEKLIGEVEPGVYYRDFEKETDASDIVLPSFPASKSLCALGGMIMNNSGGEMTLRYGQTRDHVSEISMVLADGEGHTFAPLSNDELKGKMEMNNFEGEIYRKVFHLLDSNYDVVKQAKPKTAKNSAGYALWRVWDREKGVFDLTQLFVGSQGTLGVLTKAKVTLVKKKNHKRLVALFFKNWKHLPNVVNHILPHKPESLETFDDATLKLGLRFMPEIAQKVGVPFLKFAFNFWPEALIGIRMLRLPKLIILVQLAEDTEEELDRKEKEILKDIEHLPVISRVLRSEKEAEKYWVMRRESFALLRKHVSGKRTAPFIDDFCVLPDKMPEFLPKLLKILKEHHIVANIAGHAGSGNFHIIPLMDLSKQSEKDKILLVADKVNTLIKEYEGTITAEHNDGIMRTPYLEQMYGTAVYAIFKQIKEILDPQNIFNPGKKIGGTKEYIAKHISH
ncbi:MAG: FAD-binding oxidoreductase [Candidatus Paceibacterota bacterium]